MKKIKQKKRAKQNNMKELMELSLRHFQAGNLQQARHTCEEIVEREPYNAVFLHFLGEICYRLGDYPSAAAHITKSLEIDPANADAYNNLGVVLKDMGHLEEAIHCYQQLLRLQPEYPDAYANLGTIYRAKGEIAEAEMACRRALQKDPNDFITYSNLLLTLNYNAHHNAQFIYSEHLKYARRFAEPLSSATGPYRNECVPDRRIRIGYVSPDFRRHSVNYFIEPVLASHHHDRFEVFCYSDVPRADDVTARLQRYADQWREIAGMPDEQVAEMIRKDGIDILIDLAGHTGDNRMLLFARKPAPVQTSWLGYPNTTGLKAVDYRIVDGYTDPPGLTDPFYTEELIRLPHSFLSYLPDNNSPAIGNLPVADAGHITFGSFNFFAKVSPEMVGCWADLLKAVPTSHILLKTKSLSDKPTREYAMEMFTQKGIERERIELLSYEPSYKGHLDIYNRIDIALDTYPYNGTTTTCEALWMGVPVVTLAGNRHASRVGMSLLTNIGLPELVARTEDEYRGTAVQLAADREKLRFLRERLRDMMRHSPVCDAKGFTADLELLYRRMWEKWCASA
jgi:predicted O-linked N-acetylglucosamine transferase (SPINDLY family)